MLELPTIYTDIEVMKKQQKFATRQDLINIFKGHISEQESFYDTLNFPEIMRDIKKLSKSLKIIESGADFIMYNGFSKGLGSPFIPKYEKFIFQGDSYELIKCDEKIVETNLKEQIDYSDIPKTDKKFWKDAIVMMPVHIRLSEDNYKFLSEINKPFEIVLNNILDVHRGLYEQAKEEILEQNKKTA